MFGRAIWDKLLECIFETFWNFKIFKNHEGALSQKLLKPNMWLLVNHTKPTNTVLKLISLDSPQLQNSGQLQNNTVSDIMLITIVWLLISFSRHKSALQKHINFNTIFSWSRSKKCSLSTKWFGMRFPKSWQHILFGSLVTNNTHGGFITI